MKIPKADVARLQETARLAVAWLEYEGQAGRAAGAFDGIIQIFALKTKPHKTDKKMLVIRHSVIRKIQKKWLASLMEFYARVSVPVTLIRSDLKKTQYLIEDVTEGYQFLEWFVIDSFNKDNLDEDDYKEADEAFEEEERQYRESQKKRKKKR